MRMRYQELQGKPVVDVEGVRVGRVSDVVAEPAGDVLRVTALRIGPIAELRRVTFRYFGIWRIAPREARWEQVARIDAVVHLRVPAAAVTAVPADRES